MLRIAEAEALDLRQSYRKLMVWGFRKHGGHISPGREWRGHFAECEARRVRPGRAA